MADENPPPMSLTRRLGGCGLLLLLGLAPCPVLLHVAMFYPAMRDFVFFRFFMGGIYLCILPKLFGIMLGEARRSRLGMMLKAERVTIDDVASYIDQHSADVAPEIHFKVSLPWVFRGGCRVFLCVSDLNSLRAQ